MSDRLARADLACALVRIHRPAHALRTLRGMRGLLRSVEVPAAGWILGAFAVIAGATALANTLLVAHLGPGPLAPPVHLAVTVLAGAVFLHGAAIISITAAASYLADEQLLLALVAVLGLCGPAAMLVATAQDPVSTGSIAGVLLVWLLVPMLVRLVNVPQVARSLQNSS